MGLSCLASGLQLQTTLAKGSFKLKQGLVDVPRRLINIYFEVLIKMLEGSGL
jgi:hypothetical protein